MDKNPNNEFIAPSNMFEIGSKVSTSQTTETKLTVVTPTGVPVNLSTSNTLNATDQSVTNKAEVSVGVSNGNLQGKVYVDASSTTTGVETANSTSAGVRAEVPVYNDGNKKVSIGMRVEIKSQN